jgi:hypothetical protein
MIRFVPGSRMCSMKRLVAVALLVIATTAVAGFAQRRGMRISAPSRPMSRPVFGFSHPRFGGMRPGFVPRRPMGFRARPAANRGFITFGHINGGPLFTTRSHFHRHRPHFHPFFISPFLFGGFYSPFYDPFFGDAFFADYGNSYSNPPPSSYNSEVSNSSINQLSNELSDLSAQVDLLREQDDLLRSELEGRENPGEKETPSAHLDSTPSEPPVVLVFRDGHRTEIQNYAIVGQTVWILSDKRATKVPLSELDLDKTMKINRDRGLTFSLAPSTH